MIKLSCLLLTHTFYGETTSGVQAGDEIFHRLEERDRVSFLLPLRKKSRASLTLQQHLLTFGFGVSRIECEVS
jgi:hypothetical protein